MGHKGDEIILTIDGCGCVPQPVTETLWVLV